ncbi:hypothetical protein [Undibacterium umbellatum]|uniref:DUF304 domain-containing protein n=1 Tax=Undibacterium umbellatum TaxID=2762300 RepID=A0ABR6ZG43_9BURK|nr:hypothetical protein [Undibacterium umbellatum]MBC3910649.1 hypothetical protein [Undibacterium umbellatum]
MTTSLFPQITSQLSSNERLLWSGQPRQGFMLQATDLFMIPFSLMWGGFALFWEYTVITSNAPLLFWLWGIPFVLIGLYMIIGRFFFEALQRAKTFYAVTDERVLIVSGIFTSSITSLNLHSLGELSLTEGKNGEGSVIFGHNPLANLLAGFSGLAGTLNSKMTQFRSIAGAKQVFDLIHQTKRMS